MPQILYLRHLCFCFIAYFLHFLILSISLEIISLYEHHHIVAFNPRFFLFQTAGDISFPPFLHGQNNISNHNHSSSMIPNGVLSANV